MTAFGGSAKYYDLLYADKDYVAECAFVRGVIERHAPGAEALLDFGCGSARHAIEFAKAGMRVTGIDNSGGMIALAHERISSLAPDLRDRMTLVKGDIATYSAPQTYDVVVALFHVVNYQTTNELLSGTFQAARGAMGAHGLFVFDFWYGPAVLTQLPERRVKRLEHEGLSLTRIAEPVLHGNRNIVEVQYTFSARGSSGRTDDVREVHAMRYLFLPEIKHFAAEAGLEIVEHGEWLTGAPLSDRVWSGYAAARVRQ
jgi:SAM-dependent methyltransferase